MRKLIKNKYIIITICVIVICVVYFAVQKYIDGYIFNTNDEFEVINDVNEQFSSDREVTEKSFEGTKDEEVIEEVENLSNEEVDLVMEETEGEVKNNSENYEEDVKKIFVYVTGEVNNPGVVILEEGSRIVDAINEAGGTTANANVAKVNLVYVLEDGMKVNIPNNDDLNNNNDFEFITMNSGDGGNEDYSIDVSISDKSSSSSKSSYSMVNINTATQTELESLPGIGPSLALKIINYRKENGKFSSIDEIKNVSGIGENKFENLKGYITV